MVDVKKKWNSRIHANFCLFGGDYFISVKQAIKSFWGKLLGNWSKCKRVQNHSGFVTDAILSAFLVFCCQAFSHTCVHLRASFILHQKTFACKNLRAFIEFSWRAARTISRCNLGKEIATRSFVFVFFSVQQNLSHRISASLASRTICLKRVYVSQNGFKR